MIQEHKIKLVLLGPGHGNNIDALLDLLYLGKGFEITLLTAEYKLDRNRYPRLIVREFGHAKNILRRFKIISIIRTIPLNDIFMILGGSNLYDVIPSLLYLKRRKTIFNVWGETIPHLLGKKGFRGYCYRRIMKSVDAVFCNWYGTRNIILSSMPSMEPKIYIQGWGLSRDFTTEQPVVSDFTRNFVISIPAGKCVFLNMRSIDRYNETDKILEALLILKQENPGLLAQTLMIFWHGNNVIKEMEQRILDFINENAMQNEVWCVKHPFIPTSDIRHIVGRVDVVINFVNRDQLSGSVLEAMYLDKQLIMSDIEPYRILNEQFDTSLDLISLTSRAFANEMVASYYRFVNGIDDHGILAHRRQVVEKRFIRANNVIAIRDKFQDVLTK